MTEMILNFPTLEFPGWGVKNSVPHSNASPDENRRLMIESSDLSSLHLLHLRFTCQQYLPKAPILHLQKPIIVKFFGEIKSSTLQFHLTLMV